MGKLHHKDQEIEGLKKEIQELKDLLGKQSTLSLNSLPSKIHKDTFKEQDILKRGTNVGKLFHSFQVRSTNLVNKPNEKASIENISSYL
jgi:hypothetical protein